jgi:ribonucleoside-diphosphate reductase alpha chain
MKYRLKLPDGTPVDQTWTDTVRRVAQAAAKAEKPKLRIKWAETFTDAILNFEFLPAGRILAGAGTGRQVTLFNCFVMGRIEDDLSSIFDNVKEAALTMQQGGGIGHDFSTLRPKGALVRSIGADASGPVTFMDVWDAMCKTIMSAGSRRGAMMATLRCDHPDIEEFIDAKREPGRLRNFNLSVLATDAFIRAVRDDTQWNLIFDNRVIRTVPARALWDKIMRATYEVAEPGVIFIDRIAEQNNLAYCEEIHATNPCGEQPLPAYGACLLGSINFARLVNNPFTDQAKLDETRLQELAATAIRFLDNVVDISKYPLSAQRHEAKAKRRLGLGVTGLADALIQLGVRYGSPDAMLLTDRWLALLKERAYATSADLADEKGAFPLCDSEKLLSRPGLSQLPDKTRAKIARSGLRNGLLTSIAPTGTISLLAGNVSSGIEPVFDFSYDRRILQRDGSARIERIEDYAQALYTRISARVRNQIRSTSKDAFVTTAGLLPRDHLEMQAAAQKHIDSSISKTINCPQNISFEAFKDIYLEAYNLSLKGVTTYRPNAVTGSVLSATPPPSQSKAMLPAAPAAPEAPTPHMNGQIIELAEPLQREPILAGYTYKLKWPGSDHAMYITINDTEIDGRRRPFEIFINSKNLEHYAWTLALTRMISAVFRRGGDVTFVVEELRAVFDPQGGRWMNGHYVPSLLAAIGEVIETHLRRIGMLAHDGDGTSKLYKPVDAVQTFTTVSTAIAPQVAAKSQFASSPSGNPHQTDRHCPRCGAGGYIRQDGCWLCRTCGHSNCA